MEKMTRNVMSVSKIPKGIIKKTRYRKRTRGEGHGEDVGMIHLEATLAGASSFHPSP